MKQPKSTSDLIIREFELDTTSGTPETEEELFRLLSDRIGWLIEHNMEYLLSLLYRNDVAEDRIHFALSSFSAEPANEALAHLVLQRQRERMATRKQFGDQRSKDVDEELRW